MQYDVIIVGGGMVGATLACALQKCDLRIALIDASPTTGSIEDERLIALNYGSFCLFENLGIWPALASYAAPIKQIHVSHRGHFGITRINSSIVGLDTLGYVVPAKYINAALYSVLCDTNTVELQRPAKLETLSQDDNGVTLTITTPAGTFQYATKMVIAADGSHSTVRKCLDILTEVVDYQQSALVTVTALRRDHQNIAYERFQDSGAIAMLPLVGNRVATIWTERNESIAELMNLTDTEFLLQLQKQFGYRLGRLQSVGKRSVYPLKMVHAKQQSKQNVLLMGNAAHTLHPIAAQGLNLALYEVAMIVECIEKKGITKVTAELQTKLFSYQYFSQYLAHRLSWLFSSDIFMVNMARQMGMIGLDVLPTLKKRFANQATGRVGKVPHLLIRNSG